MIQGIAWNAYVEGVEWFTYINPNLHGRPFRIKRAVLDDIISRGREVPETRGISADEWPYHLSEFALQHKGRLLAMIREGHHTAASEGLIQRPFPMTLHFLMTTNGDIYVTDDEPDYSGAAQEVRPTRRRLDALKRAKRKSEKRQRKRNR